MALSLYLLFLLNFVRAISMSSGIIARINSSAILRKSLSRVINILHPLSLARAKCIASAKNILVVAQ